MSVPVVTKAQCATDVTNVEDGMICAGGVAGEDSCSVSSLNLKKGIGIGFWGLGLGLDNFITNNFFQGDSGGPLTYESGDQHILIGETSFGPLPCAQVKIF